MSGLDKPVPCAMEVVGQYVVSKAKASKRLGMNPMTEDESKIIEKKTTVMFARWFFVFDTSDLFDSDPSIYSLLDVVILCYILVLCDSELLKFPFVIIFSLQFKKIINCYL